MSDERTTWRQLRDRIDAMPPDRLDDPIHVKVSVPRSTSATNKDDLERFMDMTDSRVEELVRALIMEKDAKKRLAPFRKTGTTF